MIFYIHMWGNSIFGQTPTMFLYSCKAHLQHSIVNYATRLCRVELFGTSIDFFFLKEDIYSVYWLTLELFAWQSVKVSRSCVNAMRTFLLRVPINGIMRKNEKEG